MTGSNRPAGLRRQTEPEGGRGRTSLGLSAPSAALTLLWAPADPSPRALPGCRGCEPRRSRRHQEMVSAVPLGRQLENSRQGSEGRKARDETWPRPGAPGGASGERKDQQRRVEDGGGHSEAGQSSRSPRGARSCRTEGPGACSWRPCPLLLRASQEAPAGLSPPAHRKLTLLAANFTGVPAARLLAASPLLPGNWDVKEPSRAAGQCRRPAGPVPGLLPGSSAMRGI